MIQRLRKILLSTPVLVAAALFALYLAAGFLALPGVLKWQAEKRVRETLGQRLEIDNIRFNPLTFRLEVGGLALSDAKGQPMLGWRRLLVEFDLYRSLVDRAWTFTATTLDAPTLNLVLDRDGRHNFQALLDRLAESGSDAKARTALPHLAIGRIVFSDGQIGLADQRLADPVVARIQPLALEVDALSTLAGQPARYRLTATTAAGESLKFRGELSLSPVAAKGQWQISGFKVMTLAKALSRFVRVDSPAGVIEASGQFDVATDANGQLGGSAQNMALKVDGLSLSAAGGKLPLLALDEIALSGGRADWGRREAHFDQLKLGPGRIAVSTDAKGRLDGLTLLRAQAESPTEIAAAGVEAPRVAAAGVAAAGRGAVAPMAWRLSISNTAVAALEVSLADLALGRRAQIDALGFGGATTAEFGPHGLALRLAEPALTLAGLRLSQGDDLLALTELRVEAAKLSVDSATSSLGIVIEAPVITAQQGFKAKRGQDELAVTRALLRLARLSTSRSGAKTDGRLDAARLALSGLAITGTDQHANLRELSIQAQALTLASTPDRFGIGLDAWRTAITELQAQREGGSLTLGTALIGVDKLSLDQDAAGLRVVAAAPRLSGTGARSARGNETASLAMLSIRGNSASLTRRDDGKLTLAAQAPTLAASAVTLGGSDQGLDLREVQLNAKILTVAQTGRTLQLDGSATTASVFGLAARQGGDSLALADGAFEARRVSVVTGGVAAEDAVADAAVDAVTVAAAVVPAAVAAPALAKAGQPSSKAAVAASEPSGFLAHFDDAALRLGSLAVIALGAPSDLGQLSRLDLAAKSLRLSQAGSGAEGRMSLARESAVDLAGDGLSAQVSDAVLRSPQDATELLRLGRATLAGGVLRLRDRLFSADLITLAQGHATTWLDAQGRLKLLGPFGAASAAKPQAAGATAGPPSVDPPWRVKVQQAQIDDFALGFEDRRESPPWALRLDRIQATASALDTASPEPMQVNAQATLASGGGLRAAGRIHADSGALDLNIDLDRVALLPAGHYLSKFAKLQVATGTVSSSGRLRQGKTAGDAALAYEGKLAIEGLVLDEVEPKRPFLSWATVATDDLRLTLAPNHIDIGELRVDKPAGRLIIAADQSVNWSDLIRRPDAAPEPKAPQVARDGGEAPPPFPVSIARLRVNDGALEFADFSLRPPFAARMHELQGVVTSLGTNPDSLAKLQLDARVDQYGSAKIRGQLSVLKPEQSTEIDMSFRNLELSSLSPYVAKFAGYRIASGQLALDLHYKLKDRKLLGTNKVVLKQMVLGEKVQSPSALDLPLELAVAILKDSNGVIDIGLPVSGDLADPKFDYGAVIGKAIGNLLGGIVTAPFRALAALFGGGDKALDEIHFEPGSDSLAPPERQKLATVARALNQRPALALTVPPTYAAAQDLPALKMMAVQRDIVERMGITLAADEQAGPIDAANARTQRAIEAAFSTRYAPAVLAVLMRRAGEAQALASPSVTRAPAQDPGAVPPPSSAPPPPAFYQGLVDRMIAEQPITDQQLAQLATRRGRAVLAELSTAGGVAQARMTLGKPAQASATAGLSAAETITLRLELKATP